MILDLQTWLEMGKPVVRVFCNGVPIPKCIYADAEAGIVRFKYPLHNEDGVVEEHLLCESEGEIEIYIDGKLVSK